MTTAQINNQNAVGLSLVGIIDRGNGRLLDYSFGVASSSAKTIAKFGLGFSF